MARGKWIVPELLHDCIAKDMTMVETAAVLGTGSQAVWNYCSRNKIPRPKHWRSTRGLQTKAATVPKITHPSPSCPGQPSPAMIRLAAFDPVVARALRQKMGEAPEETSPKSD